MQQTILNKNNKLQYDTYSGIIQQTVTTGIVIIEFKYTYNKEALWLHKRKDGGEKFMKIKRIMIPTISAVIMASQLMGCAAVSRSELLSMIDRGESIEIEAAVPAFAEQEQGTQTGLTWEALAGLDTVREMRKAWDNSLLISMTDTGKNGILYVNALGENENNNTLRQALHNREFTKQLGDKAAMAELAGAVRKQYADMDETDSDVKAVYIGINGYFNLIGDNEVNYCNADSTITRAEFMAMIMRAETPVNEELAEKADFTGAVGSSEFNKYAQELAGNSYLDLASKSLNNGTYNGSMTRAEAVYMIMDRYFGAELGAADTKGVIFSDCKDGGDIATKQQFAGKDYSKSYELTYAIQNPDKGIPTGLYKAMALANKKGFIGSETRWDEAITKAEAIELLVEALKQETGMEQYAFKNGAYENEKSLTAEEQIEQQIKETVASDPIPESEEVEQSEYTVEAIDKNMYVKEWCNTYMGPDEKAYELFGECNKGELVHLTGQVKEESNWYEYEVETGDKGFISGDYLVADNPVKQETAQKPSTSEQTPQTPQQTTDTPNNNNGESVTINPKTGEVMKPGDSWVNDAGVETVYGGNSEDYFSNR